MHVPRTSSSLAPYLVSQQSHAESTASSNLLPVSTITHSEYVDRLDASVLDTRQYCKLLHHHEVEDARAHRYQVHKKAVGDDPKDVTSFLASQVDWGSKREHRPSILFQLHIRHQKITSDPGWLFTSSPTARFKELHVVVDDMTGKPLRNFPELPIQLSTAVEGWLLETWDRMNPRIQPIDWIQRMRYLPASERASVSNKLSARRRDFRQKGRCLSWHGNTNQGSAFDRAIQDEVRAHPEWVDANTTRHMADLTVIQRKALDAENKALNAAKKEARKGKKRPAPEDVESGPGKRVKPNDGGQTRSSVQDIDPEWMANFVAAGGMLDDSGMPIVSADGTPWSVGSPAEEYHTPAQAPWHAESSAIGLTPSEDELNAMPLALDPDAPAAPISNPLLTGEALDEFFLGEVYIYLPTSRLPAPVPGADDARYRPAVHESERKQLFFALYPAMLQVVSLCRGHKFVVDLKRARMLKHTIFSWISSCMPLTLTTTTLASQHESVWCRLFQHGKARSQTSILCDSQSSAGPMRRSESGTRLAKHHTC